MVSSRSISSTIVLIIGLALAVVVGFGLVNTQAMTLLQIVTGLVLAGCFFLGRRIWLIIPFFVALNLNFRIPGQPNALLMGQVLFVSFSVLLLLMRKLPYRLQFTELEWWVLILLSLVAQVYVRNPVGVGLFGSEMVGGKPYALFAIGLISCLLLAGLRVPPGELKWVLRLSIIGGILNFGLNLVGRFVPTLGFYYGAAGVGEQVTEGVPNPERATRIGFLGNAAKNISVWVSAFISPLRSLMRPLWLLLILLSLAFAAMSGFRNTIAAVGLTYTLALYYRGGFVHIAVSAMMGILALALLAIVNSAMPLPPNAQRALSFLPGTWEESVRRDAEKSTDWRVEIWEEVLLTDRWIENKWLGDGLGFTARELRAHMAARDGNLAGVSGFDAHRENILASGDYHSGPVQTIRTIGYIGLFFFLLAMIRLAVHAHRLILRCRGTEWFPLALFVGIPLLVQPIFFTFVFGTFQSGSQTTLLGIAMIRLLQRNLPLEEPVTESKEWVPLAMRLQAARNRRALSSS